MLRLGGRKASRGSKWLAAGITAFLIGMMATDPVDGKGGGGGGSGGRGGSSGGRGGNSNAGAQGGRGGNSNAGTQGGRGGKPLPSKRIPGNIPRIKPIDPKRDAIYPDRFSPDKLIPRLILPFFNK